ncbi:hypothetical protein I3842_01G093100 [Carya illinoinensis]|uniref:Uncharacterized protein n=1 Tax=Carya illinoinensis TaxID=32201 RepID=A0A922FY98_CARIL|nr:hypothetical protein I3842_01G093100 [Carya illinoinensis]KAG6730695.1 hypothetical protein I3842_01G093100 [Carya illinoinensis]KAG6730696.1 hypothetical protein I3842_01G093100 [Carya illinoinensis]
MPVPFPSKFSFPRPNRASSFSPLHHFHSYSPFPLHHFRSTQCPETLRKISQHYRPSSLSLFSPILSTKLSRGVLGMEPSFDADSFFTTLLQSGGQEEGSTQ